MSNVRTLKLAGRVLAITAVGAAPAAALAATASRPTVSTDRHCYLVRSKVSVSGAGFAVSRNVDISIDGVHFGDTPTDASGGWSGTLVPGGLGKGQAQAVDQLLASDGTSSATTSFTVTNRTGARFLASRGDPTKLFAPFEVWGFSMSGARLPLYLHYVSPSGSAKQAVSLGRAGGQCGYLKTKKLHFFPFKPSVGGWVLQVDTQRSYAARPHGPSARIKVQISGG